jgi:photosystem II stability/assembly factor-like uncharacterized protein
MKLRKNFIAVFWTMLLSLTVSGQPGWYAQTSPIQSDLVSVSFADSVNGWAVSDSGTVIHTIDGGFTWEIQHSFGRFLPGKIFFHDQQTGWLAGVNSSTNDTALILKTMDGGDTWDTSYIHLYAKLFDIFFINDTMGWAVGFTGDTLGLRLHTIDGGENWGVQTGINVLGIFTSVHFRDTERGDICGPSAGLMHTITGGRGTSPWVYTVFNLKKPMYDLVNVGESYGCIVGADGKLFFTKDKWINFLEYDYVGGDTLWAVDAIEPLGFWVVGEAGTILFVGYNFLGLSVQDQSREIQQDLLDIDALDDDHAWAVGEEGTILFYGFDRSSGIYHPYLSKLRIYPNPAVDQVIIENIAGGPDAIELYTLEGKLLKTEPLSPGQSRILLDLGGLQSGTYILKAGEERHRIIVISSLE